MALVIHPQANQRGEYRSISAKPAVQEQWHQEEDPTHSRRETRPAGDVGVYVLLHREEHIRRYEWDEGRGDWWPGRQGVEGVECKQQKGEFTPGFRMCLLANILHRHTKIWPKSTRSDTSWSTRPSTAKTHPSPEGPRQPPLYDVPSTNFPPVNLAKIGLSEQVARRQHVRHVWDSIDVKTLPERMDVLFV